MTREERERAINMICHLKFMASHLEDVVLSDLAIIDALTLAEKALRGPIPDPLTGLVPCGCGGKANLYHNDYIYGDHQEGCWAVFCSNTCGIETSDLTSEKAAKETWNTAMGYRP